MKSEAYEFLGSDTPVQRIERWVNENKGQLKEPFAMSIASVDSTGMPSSRVVLARGFTKEGILFYTNYQSKKGLDFEQNQNCAGSFYWDLSQKQIRFQGTLKKVSAAQSDEYWSKRHHESQLSQWVSQQSKPVESRQKMEIELKEASEKFSGKQVPRPAHWGGFEIHISSVEFWIGNPHRFHDRFLFQKSQNQWLGSRLYP